MVVVCMYMVVEESRTREQCLTYNVYFLFSSFMFSFFPVNLLVVVVVGMAGMFELQVT